MQKLRVYSSILLSLVIFSINVISDNENNSSLTYKILSSAPNSQNMQVFPDQAGDFITVSDRAISKWTRYRSAPNSWENLQPK